ncbi:MAG: hypothetical protein AABZ53_14830 [Planctomycetota bacterium]
MYKSMKKYKKWIMVIGGSVLMVLFILPQGISSMSGDPQKRVIGSINGVKLRADEKRQYDLEYRALMKFPPIAISLANMAGSADHYMLLAREAESAGYVGGEGDGEASVTDDQTIGLLVTMQKLSSMGGLDARTYQQFLPMMYEQVMRSAEGQKQIEQLRGDGAPGVIGIRRIVGEVANKEGLSFEAFCMGVARYAGIRRMQDGYENAARVSDRRSLAAVREAAESLTIDFVLVPSDRLIAALPEPTEDEIKAHYEKYRNLEAAEGENGIGYRKPDRVKLEWLEVNKASVAKSIKLIDAHVRERWNKENPTGTQEAYDKGRVAFEERLRNEYAEDLIKIAESRYRDLVSEALKGFALEGKFRKLPEDWLAKRLPLEQLAQGIVAGVKAETTSRDERERWQSPVDFPAPIVQDVTAWRSHEELQETRGIGQSELQRGTTRLRFADAMFSVRELLPTTTLPLQMGVIPIFDRPLADSNGNVFYPRVIGVRPKGEPESLDEVRTQVVTDIKRLKAFETLKADVEKTTAIATTGGLDAVTAAYPPPVPAPVVPPATPPAPEPALAIQRDVKVGKDNVQGGGGGPAVAAINTLEFRALVMSRFATIDPLQPIDAQPAPARTVGLALPKSLSAAFARITKIDPLTIEELRAAGDRSTRLVTGTEIQSAADVGFPFTYEALKARMNYKLIGVGEDPDAPKTK